MTLNLRLEYQTAYGEDLYVVLGTEKEKSYPMHYVGEGVWCAELKLTAATELVYRYEVRYGEQVVRKEWGDKHYLKVDKKAQNVRVLDRWFDMPVDRSFHSSMFTDGVFHREKPKKAQDIADGYLTINADIAVVRTNQHVVLVGDGKALGNWDVKKGVVMSDACFPIWSARIKMPKGAFAYKFVIVDSANGDVVAWQAGENYYFNNAVQEGEALVVNGLRPQFDMAAWRGAGVAIPVFSLRSKSSFGVGEFNDIKLMVDWAELTGQSIIQILPINDTTMTGTWQDSYPYNANSTFALHPQFLHLPAVGELKDKEVAARFEELGKELNALPNVDYERVNNAKSEYLHLVYAQDGKKTLASKEFKAFMAANEEWLRPYAIFCALRDEKGTPDFSLWGSMAKYTKAKAAKYEKEHSVEVSYHYFLQYHLSKQLREARDYAHSKGVVLKGDIPIGISRTSVDAWVYPELFNMDSSAGAPPDDFSVLGQNWGFPTYNWAKMAEDGYAWWKARFVKMAEYFDAYRIDHILGFFRIWEIPLNAVNALLGNFNPALPYSYEEIASYGFRFEGWHVGNVAETDNVLFVEDRIQKGKFHPRITAYNTDCYKWLPEDQKEAYNRLYNDFFYRRHNDFWKWEALKKLPPLTEATKMLVCGEDLGMIPDCVPSVMGGEQILSLEIQRMPKDPKVEFGSTYDYPYLSICTTGTHDMNPLRAWWEEDRGVTQRFYNHVLGAWGEAPYFCEPWICEQVVAMHLKSPAMLTVLPWQDWVAMDGALRRENPNDERINVPANSRHYWRYRMHFSLEELLHADELNKMIKQKISESGR
ncbi:MAG: 4-alpha-glucanotransferase [Alistipes sp.]|nr:4-alpha-glucanotransferase [Alistipes sp.]